MTPNELELRQEIIAACLRLQEMGYHVIASLSVNDWYLRRFDMYKVTHFRGWRISANSWVTLPALLALAAAAAFGQTFGEITGRLSDSTGASVPGAVVTLTNVSTNGVRSTVSTEAGGYGLPSVPPGFYNVKVEHQGLQGYRRQWGGAAGSTDRASGFHPDSRTDIRIGRGSGDHRSACPGKRHGGYRDWKQGYR